MCTGLIELFVGGLDMDEDGQVVYFVSFNFAMGCWLFPDSDTKRETSQLYRNASSVRSIVDLFDDTAEMYDRER